jgi:hypothetical protein
VSYSEQRKKPFESAAFAIPPLRLAGESSPSAMRSQPRRDFS